jgi:predicted ATP-grasp superfamily ATP-dependent carboligase
VAGLPGQLGARREPAANPRPTEAPARGGSGAQQAVLVLGGYRQSLAVVRALGPLGWRCVLGLPATKPKSFVAQSRWVTEVWRHTPLDMIDNFLNDLSQFADARPDLAFLLPVCDREVKAIDAARHRLPNGIRCVLPNSTAIRVCGDKSAALRMAAGLGIPVAPFRMIDEPEQLLPAAQQLGYPCVIRATSESNRICGMKALIARSEQSLRAVIESGARPQGPFVAQQYVEGVRHCLYFYASRGSVLAAAEVRIDRTDRVDGTGYAVAGSSVAVSTVWQDYLQRICRQLDYDGFGCLQYICNPATESQTFLEINARLGGNHAGLERLGMHPVQWAMEELTSGQPSVPWPFTYPHGRSYRWFDGDLQGLLHEWKADRLDSRAAAAWCLALPKTLVGTGHLIWDWRDPKPSLQLARTRLRPAYQSIRAALVRGKRRLKQNPMASRRRRRDAWQRLLQAADTEGISTDRLQRVYDYLSVTSKVRSPRYTHADQRPGRYFPGLAAKPCHDPGDFPWRSVLENDFESIRAEVQEARASARFRPHHQKLTDQGDWNTLYFYSGNRRLDQGNAVCPRIAHALTDLPRAGNDGQAYLSVLSGKTHIKPHCGPTNVRLRCHFGIDVPDACCIRVASEIVRWETGRCLFFDDSFEHEVWNFGDQERVVLIVDIWHPDLTMEERWAIERLSQESEAIRHYQNSVADT